MGALIVFDVTRTQTFSSVPKWLDDIRSRAILQSGKDIPVILIGNKADMTFTEHVEGQREFCKEHRILDVFHTSAKNDINLSRFFIFIFNHLEYFVFIFYIPKI